MSEQSEMLADAVTRLCRDADGAAAAAEKRGFQATLWKQVEDQGLPLILVDEDQGGVGGDWEDVFAVLQAAGRYALPLPIAEALLAARLISASGIESPAGLTSLATRVQGELRRSGGSFYFDGSVLGVPWGRDAQHIAVVLTVNSEPHLCLLPTAQAASRRLAQNIAGEPRDDFRFANLAVVAAPCRLREAEALFDHAALARVCQMVGAMDAALHQSLEYAQARRQFGRSISQFQAVQQQLALFGADTAAVTSAARSACRAADQGAAPFQIAAAKLRANRAVGLATAIAHQVHAAIGFTEEYGLRHSTQRLWAWRSELGNDAYWSDRLGTMITARGAEHFWSDLTARDDASAAVVSA